MGFFHHEIFTKINGKVLVSLILPVLFHDPAGKGKLCFLSFQLHRHGTLRFLTTETIEFHHSARLSFVTDCDGSGKFLPNWKQIGDDYVILRHFLFVNMDGPGNLTSIPFSLFGEDLAARDTACCRLRADHMVCHIGRRHVGDRFASV